MFYLKQEKDINISNEINKKRNKIQNLLSSSLIKIHKNKSHRNTTNNNNLNIYSKSYTNSNKY